MLVSVVNKFAGQIAKDYLVVQIGVECNCEVIFK